MLSIRGTLLQWLLHDVAPRALTAAGITDRAAALRSAAPEALDVAERGRLLAEVQETLEQLGALEIHIWAAVAALSCIERLLSDEASTDALVLAVAARVAERAGIDLPQLAKTAASSERRAACQP